jgi:hypothetical protein
MLPYLPSWPQPLPYYIDWSGSAVGRAARGGRAAASEAVVIIYMVGLRTPALALARIVAGDPAVSRRCSPPT